MKVNQRKHKISFRPVSERDKSFLLDLYSSTRDDVRLYRHQLLDSEKDAFIRMQFEAQDRHYKKYYPDADFLIIQSHKKDIGRLYLEEWTSEIRIIDITISPAHRSKGIGRTIMSDVIGKAEAKGKAVSIHVAKNNRAMHLYEQLGFEVTGGTEVYHLMKRSLVKSTSNHRLEINQRL